MRRHDRYGHSGGKRGKEDEGKLGLGDIWGTRMGKSSRDRVEGGSGGVRNVKKKVTFSLREVWTAGQNWLAKVRVF